MQWIASRGRPFGLLKTRATLWKSVRTFVVFGIAEGQEVV